MPRLRDVDFWTLSLHRDVLSQVGFPTAISVLRAAQVVHLRIGRWLDQHPVVAPRARVQITFLPCRHGPENGKPEVFWEGKRLDGFVAFSPPPDFAELPVQGQRQILVDAFVSTVEQIAQDLTPSGTDSLQESLASLPWEFRWHSPVIYRLAEEPARLEVLIDESHQIHVDPVSEKQRLSSPNFTQVGQQGLSNAMIRQW